MVSDPHSVLVGLVSVCMLLLLFSIIRHYAHKSVIPADAWILLTGIAYGIVLRTFDLDTLPTFELSPHVIILILLPLLIFSSGRLINLQTLKSEAVPISFFAIFGVIFTSFVIGAPVAWALDIPLTHGLLIGAAAAATDPAAVAAIFHSFKMPHRLGLIVEGESLFNDGTTVVLFGLMSSLVVGSATFSFYETMGIFIWAILAAIPLGALCGWAGAKILSHWQEENNFFELSMTFIVTYLAFLLAEEILHVSGVIAVLMAAIVFVRTHYGAETTHPGGNESKDHETQTGGHHFSQPVVSEFWDYSSTVVNGLLFFSLGASTGIHDFSEVPAPALILAVVSLVLGRMILVYGGSLLLRLGGVKLPLQWQHILVFGGLRGAVSAALILMIPHDYPYRTIFLCLAFAMIAFTLIVQPTLMKIYLTKNNIAED